MLALLACSAEAGYRQGVSSRTVKPQPRGKPSGRPFAARVTDVAKAAAPTQPIVTVASTGKATSSTCHTGVESSSFF
jgi:hypothetical protein